METLTAGGYIRLIRTNANFRQLWLAQVVTLLGDLFNIVAVITIITRYGGAAEALGGLFIARLLPVVFLGPLTGVLADRFNRRNLMLVADLSRAGLVLGYLLVSSASTLWLVYLLAVLQSALGALFEPARGALLPHLTTPAERVTANALGSLTWSSMMAIGAASGGLVAGLFGTEIAFVVDALSFLFSAILLARIPANLAVACGGECSKFRLGADLLEGLAYIYRRPPVLAFALIKPLAALSGGAAFALLALLARNVFPLGQDGSFSLGLLNLAIGVGSGLGPLLAGWLLRRAGETRANLQRLIGLGFMVYGLSYMVYSNTGLLALAVAVIIIGELGGGSNWVYSTTLLQLSVGDEFRGRVLAVESMLLNLLGAFSALAGGWLLDHLRLPIGAVGIGLGVLQISIGLIWLAYTLWAGRQVLAVEAV